MNIEKYVHHEVEVSVQSELKGKHREHCLCYGCKSFSPDNANSIINCPIAAAVFSNCVKFSIVTPVWECPYFTEA